MNTHRPRPLFYAAMITFLVGLTGLQAQTGPFPPTDWPPTVSASATVDYAIFDPAATFNTPAGWNQTVTMAGGGDQTFSPITLGGLTGNKSTSTFENFADSGYANWADVDVIDVLLQVYGNANLYNADGSGISINFLEGTILSTPPSNLFAAPAGVTPPGANNSAWNWMLLSITNPVSTITGERYVGFIPANAAGGYQSGGVNSGTLRLQNMPGIIVRAVAFGPHGAFGTSNQVNVFAPLLTQILYGSNVILTWPTNAFGFTLQSTTNLGSPSAWITNSPAPVVISGQNTVTNAISGPQQFYRLVR